MKFRHYLPHGNGHVLAYRINGRWTSDASPGGYCSVYSRGYTRGQYLAPHSTMIEFEERLHLKGRFGVNFFAGLASLFAGALSGGWKQRMALAACMLHDPEVLLLDEPTAGVDPGARRDFWEELHRLSALGISVLVSTHYMDEVERCHKLAYIAEGKLLTRGTASEVVTAQRLHTREVYGEDLAEFSKTLQNLPGIEQTVMFGVRLHVNGKDGNMLERSLRKAISGKAFRMEMVETGIEDVFIYMMKHSPGHSEGRA